jgi:hypothetical protein
LFLATFCLVYNFSFSFLLFLSLSFLLPSINLGFFRVSSFSFWGLWS